MDNRKLTPEEHLASLRRLWKECFNDTDEFIDMYFTRVYSPQVDYSIERDGRVVLLELTDAGRELVDAELPNRLADDADVVAPLSAHERSVLVDLLRRISMDLGD